MFYPGKKKNEKQTISLIFKKSLFLFLKKKKNLQFFLVVKTCFRIAREASKTHTHTHASSSSSSRPPFRAVITSEAQGGGEGKEEERRRKELPISSSPIFPPPSDFFAFRGKNKVEENVMGGEKSSFLFFFKVYKLSSLSPPLKLFFFPLSLPTGSGKSQARRKI